MTKSSLFRDNIATQSTESLGIPTQISGNVIRLYVFGLGLVFILLIILSIVGNYSRKSTVKGYLLPVDGIVKIETSRSGLIDQFYISEGQEVKEGDVLFVINVGTETINGQAANILKSRIQQRSALQKQEYERLSSLHDSERKQLEEKIKLKKHELKILEQQNSAYKENATLLSNQMERVNKLYDKNMSSVSLIEDARRSYIKAKIDHLSGREKVAKITSTLADLFAKAQNINEEQANQKSQILRDLEELEEQVAEIDADNLIFVRSPIEGVVTGITVSRGSYVDNKKTLATIVPVTDNLQANLYVPSVSAGFIQVGTQVLIRYEAFPYQKFGLYNATIKSISRTAVNPEELPFLISSNDPVYIAIAILEKSEILYNQRKIKLRSGSKFDADLILEKRRIIEFLLAPLQRH